MRKTTTTSVLALAMIVALAPAAHARGDRRSEHLPRVRVANVQVVEGDDGITTIVFALRASRKTHATVVFTTKDGSAVAGVDYAPASGTVRFPRGSRSIQLAVEIMGDTLDEPDETFHIKLSNAVGATIADRTGRATITDDDEPGAASISVSDDSETEGQTAAFTVNLSAPLAEPVTVNYATANGSAAAPADYQATSGTLTFDPGQTVAQVTVPLVADTVDEVDETYALNLSGAAGAVIEDAVGIGTIRDGTGPSIAIANASVTEGNTGTVNAVFTVTMSIQSSQVVTLDYSTADGSAAAPADYVATGGTLTFDPGQTTKQIVVPVVGDTQIETAETFSLNLTNPVNATLSDPTAQGTITDNDTVTITIGSVTVTEVNTGTRDAVFTITLSAASASTVTVDFTTSDGSAVAPGDYLAVAGTLTFAPGQVSKQIVVQTVGDTLVETNETFSVNLSNPANATIAGSGFGIGTITNND